jgi:ribosomal protein S18 acetylase RimI-like enzyme
MDYAYSPHAEKDIHREILAWADQRAHEILDTSCGHPAWFIYVFKEQDDRIRDLEAMGFTCQADVGDDSWSKVLMLRNSDESVQGKKLPTGFRIRPMAGDSEVEDCVNLHRVVFESKNMTVGWRAATLRHPAYQADLDLVGVAPDGELAAFCVCWVNTNGEGTSGQIEPLGVKEVYRGSGLGSAILAEGIRRLIQHGATRIFVETDRNRNAAFQLYDSSGFRVNREVLVFRKDYV